jgi:hypothetical protein
MSRLAELLLDVSTRQPRVFDALALALMASVWPAGIVWCWARRRSRAGFPNMRARLVLTIAVMQACAPAIAVRSGGYCDPPARANLQLRADPTPNASAPRSERLAALLGLSATLLERRATGELSIESRVRVLERIEAARLSVAASSAELDCESQRAEQTANYLAHGETSAVQGLTVASIAAAAAAAIAGVFLSTANASHAAQNIFAIAGGVVTAGLGLGSLYVHPQIAYGHARNLLSDLWRGPSESANYAPVVWAYLSRREFSNQQRESIREKIVARWRRYQGVVQDPADVATLFGSGGTYDAELLQTRAKMLDEVRAEVDLFNQDLETLAAELVR